jgi:hypothetical protein
LTIAQGGETLAASMLMNSRPGAGAMLDFGALQALPPASACSASAMASAMAGGGTRSASMAAPER